MTLHSAGERRDEAKEESDEGFVIEIVEAEDDA